MSIYYLGTCVKTKRVCSQQLVLSGEAASVSVTKQQFRATPRKVIDTPGWLMGNQSGTLERAIPRLPFSTYFALILPLLFKITWLTVGSHRSLLLLPTSDTMWPEIQFPLGKRRCLLAALAGTPDSCGRTLTVRS